VKVWQTMSSQVRYTAYSIALNLDVWTEHLADERFKTAKFNNQQFVVGYKCGHDEEVNSTPIYSLLTARLPNAALAARCTSVS
jgi:hypothetical protein